MFLPIARQNPHGCPVDEVPHAHVVKKVVEISLGRQCIWGAKLHHDLSLLVVGQNPHSGAVVHIPHSHILDEVVEIPMDGRSTHRENGHHGISMPDVGLEH